MDSVLFALEKTTKEVVSEDGYWLLHKRSPLRNADDEDFAEIRGGLPFVKENNLEEEENFGDVERSF